MGAASAQRGSARGSSLLVGGGLVLIGTVGLTVVPPPPGFVVVLVGLVVVVLGGLVVVVVGGLVVVVLGGLVVVVVGGFAVVGEDVGSQPPPVTYQNIRMTIFWTQFTILNYFILDQLWTGITKR